MNVGTRGWQTLAGGRETQHPTTYNAMDDDFLICVLRQADADDADDTEYDNADDEAHDDENDHDDYHDDYNYEYDADVHYDDGRYCDVCMMMLVRAMVLVAR